MIWLAGVGATPEPPIALFRQVELGAVHQSLQRTGTDASPTQLQGNHGEEVKIAAILHIQTGLSTSSGPLVAQVAVNCTVC